MLKKRFLTSIVVFLLAGLTYSVKAQSDKDTESPLLIQKDAETGNWQYSEVVNYDTTKLSNTDVYKNAKDFLISTLKTGDNNIVSDEKDFSKLINTGNLILKPIIGFGFSFSSVSMDFKIKVSFKSGRYRILVDNIVIHSLRKTSDVTAMPVTQPYGEINNSLIGKKFKKNANETLSTFIVSLKRAVANQEAAKESSW